MFKEILRMENITVENKNDPALYNAWLNARKGEVIGLFGLNNSGKTTLVKILCGQILCTAGRIYLNEEPVSFTSPQQARKMGVICINRFQALFPEFDIIDNIFLTRGHKGIIVNRQALHERTQALLDRLGMDISADTKLLKLDRVQQFMVLVAKALSEDARLIVIEDILSDFSESQIESIRHVLDIVCKEGVAVIVSDYLAKTLMRLCQRIFVLRDGSISCMSFPPRYDEKLLTTIMIGREIDDSPLKARPYPHDHSLILEFNNVWDSSRLKGLSFYVEKNQITGLLVKDESMEKSIIDMLQRLNPVRGEICLNQRELTRKSLHRDVAIIHEEDMIFDNLSLYENITLFAGKEHSYLPGLIQRAKIQTLYNEMVLPFFKEELQQMRKHAVQNLDRVMRKEICICRNLIRGPSVLFLLSPTKLMDNLSARKLLNKIAMLKHCTGMSSVIISNNIYEQLFICDQIYFINNGKVEQIFHTANYTYESILDFYGNYFMEQ